MPVTISWAFASSWPRPPLQTYHLYPCSHQRVNGQGNVLHKPGGCDPLPKSTELSSWLTVKGSHPGPINPFEKMSPHLKRCILSVGFHSACLRVPGLAHGTRFSLARCRQETSIHKQEDTIKSYSQSFLAKHQKRWPLLKRAHYANIWTLRRKNNNTGTIFWHQMPYCEKKISFPHNKLLKTDANPTNQQLTALANCV